MLVTCEGSGYFKHKTDLKIQQLSFKLSLLSHFTLNSSYVEKQFSYWSLVKQLVIFPRISKVSLDLET